MINLRGATYNYIVTSIILYITAMHSLIQLAPNNPSKYISSPILPFTTLSNNWLGRLRWIKSSKESWTICARRWTTLVHVRPVNTTRPHFITKKCLTSRKPIRRDYCRPPKLMKRERSLFLPRLQSNLTSIAIPYAVAFDEEKDQLPNDCLLIGHWMVFRSLLWSAELSE